MADDEELLALAARAGCAGVFIALNRQRSPAQGVGKKFNLVNGRDFAASVRRIQRHKILVAGSFIMGWTPTPGHRPANRGSARDYGIDVLNTLFLTPLPGTRLWTSWNPPAASPPAAFPEDWRYYTLSSRWLVTGSLTSAAIAGDGDL